jgi:DNA polymerase-3 subunit beta
LAQKELPIVSKKDLSLVVPASALGDVLRIIGDAAAGEVTIAYDETQIQFNYNNSQLITKQIDGSFPPYRQLIPEKSEVKIQVERAELAAITKLASLFAKESAGSITLEVSEEKQSINITSVASQVGENSSSARATVSGSGKVTLNSRYLIEALNVMDDHEVVFRFSGKISPCVLEPKTKNPDYLHIIMPLKS